MSNMASRLRDGLDAAIAALNDKNGRGGAAILVDKLGISHAAISQWTAVPVKRVEDVERITGVSREVLRPDLYASQPPTRQPRKKAA